MTETKETPDPHLVYHELSRLIERMHRRFLDVIRIELGRRGIRDISPVQVVMLLTINTVDMSVRDLIDRGAYLGSNASYNLKNLVDGGYVERTTSASDKRAAKINLSEKGKELRDQFKELETKHLELLFNSGGSADEVEDAYRLLRRLDRVWNEVIQYGADDPF